MLKTSNFQLCLHSLPDSQWKLRNRYKKRYVILNFTYIHFILIKITYLLANCEETHAKPHFRLVNMNFKAFVHCSSELN